MLLSELAETSRAVAETRSRNAKASRLADCLRRLPTSHTRAGVAYLSGELPQGRIGVGWAAVAEARRTRAADTATLSLADLDRTLRDIAAAAGPGSGRARKQLLGELFARATAREQEFIARLLLGELRQGASDGVMIDAVAAAAGVSVVDVRRAAMLSGDLGTVGEAALRDGIAGLSRFSIQLFRPLAPMLAQPADDPADAIARLDEARFELKLDGARVQLHKDGDDVRVFSRRLNDVTVAVPELVEHARALPARRLILDGETIALRPGGAPHPFQVTMKRFGRRLQVDAMRARLPLSVFYFDCLYVDGDALIDVPAHQRAAALARVVPAAQLVPAVTTRDPAQAERFMQQALASGHEGLVAKSLDAGYEAGGRGGSWLKLKLAHTFDLVVLAAEWGSGRRRGWLSNLHLGARDPTTNGFVMLGKTFKGLTDELLAWQTRELLARELTRDQHVVHVRPELVVEIACNDIQHSPHYPGGIALRFARVKRYRPDKSAAQADTLRAVLDAFAFALPDATEPK